MLLGLQYMKKAWLCANAVGEGKRISNSLFTSAAHGRMATVSRKSTSAINYFSCELNCLLFPWIFLKEPLTDELWLLKHVYLADLFFYMSAMSLSLPGKQWRYLLPTIKFELSNERTVDSSPTRRNFSIEISDDTVIFGYGWVKCTKIWKIRLSHYFPNDPCTLLQNQE